MAGTTLDAFPPLSGFAGGATVKRFLLILLLFAALPLWAQQEVEMVSLKNRPADQLLPVLQPLVEPGGAISGMGNQLIIKASRRNREQLKQLLQSLDTAPRMLRILVSQNRGEDRGGQEAGVSGDLNLGSNVRIIQPGRSGGGSIQIQRGDSTVNVRALDTRSTRSAASSQMVQVMEGGKAFIQVGQSIPIPLRQAVAGPGGMVVTETTVYRDMGQGFYAEPRLTGDRVTLEISPSNDTPGPYGPGSVNTQHLSTTVSGRLGQWIPLGGSAQAASLRDRNNSELSTRELRDDRSLWLLVEEIK